MNNPPSDYDDAMYEVYVDPVTYPFLVWRQKIERIREMIDNTPVGNYLKDMQKWRSKALLRENRIKDLEEWINQEGERHNTCTYDILNSTICAGCKCPRNLGEKK